TPLNAIVGWAALMVQGDLEQELTDRAIAAIDRNARAQAKLIEDVLDVSRIVSGKLYLKVQPVDLGSLARVAVDSVSHSALAKKIELDVRVEEGQPDIVADPDRLQQVLWNLLSNAIKFTGEGGHVSVSVSRVDGHARIAVSDDGIGIPAEFVPYVFERFRQADASSTRTHGGLGLGLAIVRHLVEMHGGTVTAESPGPGQGSTFTVILPAVPPVRTPEARQTPQAPVATGEPDLTGLQVLLLDLGEIGELARAALASRGADVETAESMEEALSGLARRPADVVVADVDALGPQAERFARELRDRPREAGGGAPVLAISAHSRSEDRVRALVAGYQAFLSEPVNPVELAAVVASLARRRPEYEPRR
ncbi:MAG TPA: hybrid sensor histidine kinase/response regulator, partial [Vicinamibacteria bacterium]|nr:hybrid sensor histidine kinase/response regulator [Vicinamibacteria bacterium]